MASEGEEQTMGHRDEEELGAVQSEEGAFGSMPTEEQLPGMRAKSSKYAQPAFLSLLCRENVIVQICWNQMRGALCETSWCPRVSQRASCATNFKHIEKCCIGDKSAQCSTALLVTFTACCISSPGFG